MKDRTLDTYYKKALDLSEMIGQVKTNMIPALNGSSTSLTALTLMQNNSAKLVHVIANGYSLADVRNCFNDLAQSVDSSVIFGLIGQEEAKKYYDLLDNLWNEIDRNY